MAELKTKLNDADVGEFLNKVSDPEKREDSFRVLEMMREISGQEPRMWGSSIVGFGTYHYKYASGREGEWMRIGFSPRKQNLTVYIMNGFERYDQLMAKLGKYKTGKSCLYLKRLSDVDESVLSELITESVKYFDKKYGKN
ncbi:MAG: DUF1801 domain-containing protein [Pyrinomonadaceae bacterium]|nr:DUF1801 domain-containing protein [Pyrinomonadaceae bacterium]